MSVQIPCPSGWSVSSAHSVASTSVARAVTHSAESPPPSGEHSEQRGGTRQLRVAHRADHPQPERHVPEQVQGESTAQSETRRVGQGLAELVDRALHPNGEDDDPGDDHEMEVAVAVGRRQHRVVVIA